MFGPERHRGGRLSRLLVPIGAAAYVAAVYLVVVVGGGSLAHRAVPDVPLAVAATAVVAVTLESVQRALRRRFARTDQEVLAAFARTLSGAPAVAEIAPRMAELLAAATGAARSEVWLVRPSAPDGKELAARWPPGAAPIDPAAPGVQADDVVQAGERLGFLLRAGGDPHSSPTELRLVKDLVDQAGVALRTVALSSELHEYIDRGRARAAELRASRQRIVETGDIARRRLERDVHDGAQQHLVALAVNLSLAAAVAGRDPAKAAELVAELGPAAAAALATLEELSRGIYPAVLADSGPAQALRAAVATSPLPVSVVDDTGARSPMQVEAGAYFTALEAVQNAVKHSGATRVDVRFTRSGGGLAVTVTDDGSGFDDAASSAGSGLAGVRDRIESLGGVLTVRSTQGHGTTVSAEIPVGPGAVEWTAAESTVHLSSAESAR
jgi:signal transduction histidine kinase